MTTRTTWIPVIAVRVGNLRHLPNMVGPAPAHSLCPGRHTQDGDRLDPSENCVTYNKPTPEVLLPGKTF